MTLIELMVVVAIIGLLASIALPNYIRYQLKAKTAEVKTVMGGIRVSQDAFRAEIDNYANVFSVTPTSLPGTVKADFGAPLCPSACDRTTTQTDCTVFDCIGYSPGGLVYYQYVSPAIAGTTSVPSEFAIGAQADLDGDGVLSSWAYRSANIMSTSVGQLADGISTCALAIEGYTVTDCDPGTY